MKRNVDLTQRGDFSEHNFHFDPVTSILTLFRSGGGKFPWKLLEIKPIYSQDDILHKGLFHLGNKHDRMHYKAMQIAESNCHCDRCGSRLTPLNSIPLSTLCRKCFKDLDKEYGKKSIVNPLPDYQMQIGENYWTSYLNHKAN